MARFLFDFRCQACGEVEEHFVDRHLRELEHACGGTMTRLISPVRSKLDGLDPGFPDAHDKWARDHEKAGRQPVPE